MTELRNGEINLPYRRIPDKLPLTLEQHEFELFRSTYTWILFFIIITYCSTIQSAVG